MDPDYPEDGHPTEVTGVGLILVVLTLMALAILYRYLIGPI